MRYVYPVGLEKDEEGIYVATARDIPEAITDGASVDKALGQMSEALGAALAGYITDGRALPVPSERGPGEWLVPIAPLVAAKLALRAAMQEQGLSNVALAERLEVSEGAIRRLVNPDHASRLDRVVAALAAIGHSLIIEDQKLTNAA